MKIIVLLLLVIINLAFSAETFKNAICGLQHSKDGENGIACRAKIPSWSYKADTDECVPFNYGGCNGNDNRFDSLEQCNLTCKK